MNTLKLIEFEEGYRGEPYLCSEYYPTVGIGIKLGPKCSPEFLDTHYRFILPYQVACEWALHHIDKLTSELSIHPDLAFAFNRCNMARKAILISMAYQLGINGLAKFKNMISELNKGDYAAAAYHGLDSKWAIHDTPGRAARHMTQMKNGEWLAVYG